MTGVRALLSMFGALVWLAHDAHRARASDQADRVLTLRDVLQSVEEHHPLLAVELRSIEVAAGRQLSARGAYDPSVEVKGEAVLEGYYDYRKLDARLEQLTPLWGTRLYAGYRLQDGNLPDYYGELETLNRGEVRAGMSVPLWRDRAIDPARAGRRSTDAQREAAEWQRDVVLLDLQQAAAAAYFDWAAALRGREVHRDLLTLSRVRANQIAAKVRSGALAPVEELDNQRSLLSREAKLVEAQRKLENAAIKLSLFLRDARGRPEIPEEQFALSLRPPELPPELSDPAQVERALDDHPLLSRYRSLLRDADARVELAENAVAPRIDVMGEVSKDLGTGDDEALTTLEPMVVQAGVALKVPLGLRKERGKRDAERAKLAALQTKAGYARDKVRAAVQDAASALRNAIERADRTRRAADVAEALAKAERKRFDLGATSLIWVTLREKAAADAELDAVRALADANTAWVSFRVALANRPLMSGPPAPGP